MSEDSNNYRGFDSTKYARVGSAAADAISEISGAAVAQSYMPYFLDGSDSYANAGMAVSFHHIPSGQNLYFKAFITAFNETYSCDWVEESVYGRADPIVLFKNTSRRVNLTLNIPASSESEAYQNLSNVGTLAQFLYPAYTDVNDATTIGQSPLCRLKIMNILRNQSGNDKLKFSDYSTSGANYGNKGVLGAITSLSINHNLDNPEAGVIESGYGVILPKLIEVAVDFIVIHEHALGWKKDTAGRMKFGTEHFPYGTDLSGSAAGGARGPQENIGLNIAARQRNIDAQEQALDEEIDALVYDDNSWENNEANDQNRIAAAVGVLRHIGSNVTTAIGSGARRAYNATSDAIGAVEIGGQSIGARRDARRIESAQDNFIQIDEDSNSILD